MVALSEWHRADDRPPRCRVARAAMSPRPYASRRIDDGRSGRSAAAVADERERAVALSRQFGKRAREHTVVATGAGIAAARRQGDADVCRRLERRRTRASRTRVSRESVNRRPRPWAWAGLKEARQAIQKWYRMYRVKDSGRRRRRSRRTFSPFAWARSGSAMREETCPCQASRQAQVGPRKHSAPADRWAQHHAPRPSDAAASCRDDAHDTQHRAHARPRLPRPAQHRPAAARPVDAAEGRRRRCLRPTSLKRTRTTRQMAEACGRCSRLPRSAETGSSATDSWTSSCPCARCRWPYPRPR